MRDNVSADRNSLARLGVQSVRHDGALLPVDLRGVRVLFVPGHGSADRRHQDGAAIRGQVLASQRSTHRVSLNTGGAHEVGICAKFIISRHFVSRLFSPREDRAFALR